MCGGVKSERVGFDAFELQKGSVGGGELESRWSKTGGLQGRGGAGQEGQCGARRGVGWGGWVGWLVSRESDKI